mgnify:CR=1 FL=1
MTEPTDDGIKQAARMIFKMYLAYLDAGFTKFQALELAKIPLMQSLRPTEERIDNIEIKDIIDVK